LPKIIKDPSSATAMIGPSIVLIRYSTVLRNYWFSKTIVVRMSQITQCCTGNSRNYANQKSKNLAKWQQRNYSWKISQKMPNRIHGKNITIICLASY
jgi:hypothetical protein